MGGSLFPADNSGIAGILFGLVGLVLFGVTITLVMDGQLNTGGSDSDPASVSSANAAEIAGLEKQIDLLRTTQQQRNLWQAGGDDLLRIRPQLAELQQDVLSLKEDLAGERVRTREIRESFAQYRTDYRKRLWAAGIGTTLDTLSLPNGRTYSDVTVRSISASGIKISHAAGWTSITVPDLPAKIRETYHLSVTEARRIQEDELRRREQEQRAKPTPPDERTDRRPTRPSPGSRRDNRDDDEDKAKKEAKKVARIAVLQAEATQLRSQISILAGQVSEARSQAAYGKRRSPPGSLETWTQRATRLSNLQGQASAKLSTVETELRRLDPRYRPPLRR